jgi:cytochrome c-type biogenesis protein CcmH/NrfG
VDYLVTLGKIYESANLLKRAQATYERALKLEPQNESLKKSLKALKRI